MHRNNWGYVLDILVLLAAVAAASFILGVF